MSFLDTLSTYLWPTCYLLVSAQLGAFLYGPQEHFSACTRSQTSRSAHWSVPLWEMSLWELAVSIPGLQAHLLPLLPFYFMF